MTRGYSVTALVGLAVVISACTSSTEQTPSTEVATSDSPATTVAPAPAAAQSVYDQVAASIALIETDIASGSGILIDRSTVLTAAHVVWPYDEVRVVFSNGTELRDAAVVGSDLFGDLAIIDVSGTPNLPAPVAIGDGEILPLGSPVYLVGYPGESESFPEPTITEGILSRKREWEAGEWTFLQSDASVAGGQSGGALVDENGRVIGITNFSFIEEFGLSGSLTDASAAIELMRAGTSAGGLTSRLPPPANGTDFFEVEFGTIWEDSIYVFEEPLYSEVSFDASSVADVTLTLGTIDGIEIASVDETTEGEERIDELISYAGPHLVRVETVSGPGEVRLRSNVKLTPWPDPDDGRKLTRNSMIIGNADYPGDYDWYVIDLGKGQAITVDVDAITFDPVLMIDGPDGLGYLEAVDDDSGGGLFDTNPRIVFTAGEPGTFYVVVGDNNSSGPGAYRLSVD